MTDLTTADRAPPQSAAVRLLSAILGAAIALAGLAWGADLYRMLGLNFLAEQFLAAVFGLGLALVFVTSPWIGYPEPSENLALEILHFGSFSVARVFVSDQV